MLGGAAQALSCCCCPTTLPCDACARQFEFKPVFELQGLIFHVHQIDGISALQRTGPLLNGTLLHLERSSQIKAGGHHLASGATPTLDAGADFQARTEYMCATHGWIAADNCGASRKKHYVHARPSEIHCTGVLE